MYKNSRLTPEESFPEDLTALRDEAVEVLHSKIHREIDAEYDELGELVPETEFRLEELTEELDRRDDEQADSPVADVTVLKQPGEGMDAAAADPGDEEAEG
jgi:septation ring formation regulator EzrA